MVDFLLIQRFLLALALGAFLGLEREHAKFKGGGRAYAGIRTFPLISLFGALAAYLGELISPMILYLSLLLFGLLVVAAYYTLSKSKNDPGTTSEIAGLLAFFVGILVYYGELSFAVALSIVVTLILYARSYLHDFAQKITTKELQSTIAFAVIAFVILPFLPNRWYGVQQIFNPYVLWLMVVFISGISFVGYVLMKWFGERGVSMAGIFGGLASSTATTLSFAERSQKALKSSRAFALAVILANGVMFVRTFIEVAVVNPSLSAGLLLPFALLLLVTLLFSYVLWRKVHQLQGRETIELSSPLSILSAIKVAVLFAAILAVVKVAHAYFSSSGVYVVSLLSGMADTDAATISLAQLAKTSLSAATAEKGIILAVLMNLVMKGAMVYWFGAKEFRKLVWWFFAVIILLGAGIVMVL